MPNFQNGKIYKLICDDDCIYIGSTTMSLQDRFLKHKSNYKNNEACYSVIKIFEKGNPQISLIENYPCDTKLELIQREQFYISQNKTVCTNQINAYLNKKEYLKEYQKRNMNKYREANRKYRLEHKDILNERAKTLKFDCLYCDCSVRKKDKAIHERSHKHIAAIAFFKAI